MNNLEISCFPCSLNFSLPAASLFIQSHKKAGFPCSRDFRSNKLSAYKCNHPINYKNTQIKSIHIYIIPAQRLSNKTNRLSGGHQTLSTKIDKMKFNQLKGFSS